MHIWDLIRRQFLHSSIHTNRQQPQLQSLEERAVPAATLQVIHNSPFAAAAVVDVYVNGDKFLDDLAFRDATKYVEVPNGVPLTIDIVAGNAADNSAPVFTTTVTLEDNKNYIAVAIGDPSDKTTANKFTLAVTDIGIPASGDPSKAAVLVQHGAIGAGTVDVGVRTVGTVVDDLEFGTFDADYLQLPTINAVLDVTAPDGSVRVASFYADLTGAGGKSLVALASGFLTPPAATDPGFGILVVNADGTTALLTQVPELPTSTYAAGGVDTAGLSAITLYDNAGTVIRSISDPLGSKVGYRVASGDLNGDGVAELIGGYGPGSTPTLHVFDGATGKVLANVQVFESTFNGGLFVSLGDFNRDGVFDIVVSPDVSGGPRVRILDGSKLIADGSLVSLADFFAIEDPQFFGGVRVGTGDVNDDGIPDLAVGAGFGGGPRVALFNGATVSTAKAPEKLVSDFFAFESTLRNGVFVTIGDLNGDFAGDLIFGAGPGGGPRVLGVDGKTLLASNGATLTTLTNFFAGNVNARNGVRVSAKDLDGDLLADLVIGRGAGDGTTGSVYLGKNLSATAPTVDRTFDPLPNSTNLGLFVG
ncbi:DUF4397 domain-containing protein [Tuwongella immobilis]|uniref:DUF4397 domain-containing protein n=1 Tax=Tuwongella immobilis TaxID=692036 RepID=A0A6C2YX19_9BACT|nr:DUF4397 domain-containing protein [Tuwongella immobilis]VIP05683.1 hemolysin-type calcium-binding region domain protein : Hemolysin-type calcium-binding region domain protein OS=Rhodopirellula maiorica SM1 GN=RMSM_03614 PE=4 SV=1: DUF4397 [Tuwongella immobilis]VTS08722.1 hemolysin-type calcium-binding region domain protein : Hemolysin-type calcium-binding region domain protein OS=Rhodopirellula maiorica SM1 GN=RMSM_03614 PE=4 SV=1: DUF4397 [Tuwongella immobilis]